MLAILLATLVLALPMLLAWWLVTRPGAARNAPGDNDDAHTASQPPRSSE
ncbi:hypothetical protein [Verminephrobacter aporrectodeae]|nr:hypothetical protein [Verminephrobacter aporrectodeae]